MAVPELTGPGDLTRRWRRVPVAVRIALVYLAARAVTMGFFTAAAALSGATSRFGMHPPVGSLLAGWDGQWYWYIAVHGYPRTLPVGADGTVSENQWAFMPVYPYLARLLGGQGVGWTIAAVAISLAAGYLACLTLYRLLAPRLGEGAAQWAVVFFACAPLAAIFQIAYAESLFLLWLLLALVQVTRRRYGWLYLLVPLMGYTRPGVLAFALFLGLYGIARWMVRRRDPLPAAHVVHIVLLGAWATIVGLSWPVVAGMVTGRADAYFATELSWRRGWIGIAGDGFAPFQGFWEAAGFWFSTWGLGAVTGYVVLTLLVVGIAAMLLVGPRVRTLGPEIRLWSASYLLYLLAVFFPQSSIFRLMVPLSPLWGAAAVPRARAWRLGVLALCLIGQWWWIYNMYALGNTFWQIP